MNDEIRSILEQKWNLSLQLDNSSINYFKYTVDAVSKEYAPKGKTILDMLIEGKK
jgi:hypothetical protein